MAVETFNIVVKLDSSSGVRKADDLEKRLRRVESAGGRVEKALVRAVALVGVAKAVQGLKTLSDEYTQHINVLGLVTGGMDNAHAAFDRLMKISNDTRTPIEGNVKLFQRASLAARDLGASQEILFKFTRVVGTALSTQGISALESKGALLQLSQALSQGRVEAQEFNAIIEGAYPVALAAARGIDEASGSVARLRKMVKEGKVTSKILFEGILSQSDAIAAQMAKVQPTISNAFIVMRNNVVAFIGKMNESTGAMALVTDSILFLGRNVEPLIRSVAALSLALGVHFAKKAVAAAVLGIRTLTAAMAANPFGAVLVALTVVISFLVAFADKLKLAEDRTATLADLAAAAWEKIRRGLARLVGWFKQAFEYIHSLAAEAFGKIEWSFEGVLRFFARIIDGIIGLFVGLFRSIEAVWHFLPDTLRSGMVQARNRLAKIFNQMADDVAVSVSFWVALFAGTYRAIVGIFSVLPAFFKQIFQKALAGALELVEWGLKKMTGLLNKLPGVDLDPPRLDLGGVRKAAERDLPSIGRAAAEGFRSAFEEGPLVTAESLHISQMENEYAGAGTRLGRAIKTGFLSGFDLSPAEDLLDSLLDRAEEIAKGRKPRPTGADQQGKPPPPVHEKSKIPTFKELLALYERESGLLRHLALDREVYAEAFRFEDAMKKSLTASQREILAAAVRERQLLQERADVLDDLAGAEQRAALHRRALTSLLEDGSVALREYNRLVAEHELAILRSSEADNNATAGFVRQLKIMVLETRNAAAEMGAAFASVFGPGGSLTQGIADATARSIVFGDSFSEGMKNVAKTALASVISGLVKMGLTMLANAMLGRALQASAQAQTSAAAASAAAAWAAPAALASLATLGANAAPASAAVAGTVALSSGLAAVQGFAAGGYTGNSGERDVAGVVHGREFVVNAAATRKNRAALEAMNAGRTSGGVTVNVVNNAPGVVVEAREVSRGEVEVIARRAVREEAPRAVAQDLSAPSSVVASAMARHTTAAQRRR
jgi:tape measure domain-containing protein